MIKLIDLELFITELKMKEMLVVVKADKDTKGLGIIHNPLFTIFRIVEVKNNKFNIYEYDRYGDGSFKGFSYLELSNVETLGTERYELRNVAEGVSTLPHLLSIVSGVNLGTSMAVTEMGRLSMIVKETYNLLNDYVTVVNIVPTEN